MHAPHNAAGTEVTKVGVVGWADGRHITMLLPAARLRCLCELVNATGLESTGSPRLPPGVKWAARDPVLLLPARRGGPRA